MVQEKNTYDTFVIFDKTVLELELILFVNSVKSYFPLVTAYDFFPFQAQRDYFGAHTYELLSDPGKFIHTNWTGHGGTVSSTTYQA